MSGRKEPVPPPEHVEKPPPPPAPPTKRPGAWPEADAAVEHYKAEAGRATDEYDQLLDALDLAVRAIRTRERMPGPGARIRRPSIRYLAGEAAMEGVEG